MNVLVACESSGIVAAAFRARGHNAYSCDLLPCDVPEWSRWHLQGDAQRQAYLPSFGGRAWDLLIAHPPCTYLCGANAGHMRHGCSLYTAEQAVQLRADAAAFFMAMVHAPVARIAVENPVGVMSRLYRKPDQYIQPFEYGHPESKKTGLWLKNLAPLVPSKILPLPPCGHWENQTPSGQNRLGPSADRWKQRSKTYEGIAAAMAEQWGS